MKLIRLPKDLRHQIVPLTVSLVAVSGVVKAPF